MTTKSQPNPLDPLEEKPLDPLEELVRKQIDAEYTMERQNLLASQVGRVEDDVADRLARVQAAIRGELPVPTVPDPLAGVPKADSGEALVGRICVAWNDGRKNLPIIGKVLGHDRNDPDHPYFLKGDDEGCWRNHASPIEHGVPEAIRKAVEG